LGYQQPQFAIANDPHPLFRPDMRQAQHLHCGCQRLNKERHLIWHAIRNRMQIGQWQNQELGQGPISPQNANSGTREALGRDILPAKDALATANVNLPHHSPADPLCTGASCLGASYHCTNKFVPQHPVELPVSAEYFQIGTANACQAHLDERLARTWDRSRIVSIEAQLSVKDYCLHLKPLLYPSKGNSPFSQATSKGTAVKIEL
jgi:hypothetical protein